MLSYNVFLEKRKEMVKFYKLRNLLSGVLCAWLSLEFLLLFSNPVYGFVIASTAGLCLFIFIMKVRGYNTLKKYNKHLHEYIRESISLARKDADYSVLNELINSKYYDHCVFVLSQFPLSSIQYEKINDKKIKEDVEHLKDLNLSEKDLLKMTLGDF